MKIDELKRAKDQRPFQSFLIRTADEREVPVNHPDAVAWDAEFPRIVVCVLPGGGVGSHRRRPGGIARHEGDN